MKKELENYLYEKYPYIFSDKNKSIQESCMSWGISCGNGWYDLIKNVCYQITQYEKNVLNEKSFRYNKDYVQVKFKQIKEKFGGLNIYFSGGDDYVRGIVNMAEAISYCVCESCGNKGEPNKSGWISTLCENCRRV